MKRIFSIKTIGYIYTALISATFCMAMYVSFSNTNPVERWIESYKSFTNPHIESVHMTRSNWVEADKTLITPNDGLFKVTDVNTGTGTFIQNGNNSNEKVLILSMKFRNTSNKVIRPHDIYPKLISVFQKDKLLEEGMLRLNNAGGSKFNKDANNSVKFYKPNESASIVVVYSYNPDDGDITVNYGNHKEVYNPSDLKFSE